MTDLESKLSERVEALSDALEDIARLAEGRNIALSVIVAMVRSTTGFDATNPMRPCE